MSAFQSGPAAASRALARIRAGRLCRLEALGRATAIPSTISMPAHCSSDQESYCSALICECIHAGATVSAGMVYLLRGTSAGPALPRSAYGSEVPGRRSGERREEFDADSKGEVPPTT